jgi:pilus assembly protein Flp/PilA
MLLDALCIQELTMRKLARLIAKRCFIKSERGVTAIEYGLIASLIAVAIIGALSLLGTNLNDVFTSVSNALQ